MRYFKTIAVGLLIGFLFNLVLSYSNYYILTSGGYLNPLFIDIGISVIFAFTFTYFIGNYSKSYFKENWSKKIFWKCSALPIIYFILHATLITFTYSILYQDNIEIQKTGNYMARTISSYSGTEEELNTIIKPFFEKVIAHQKLDPAQYDFKIKLPTKESMYGQTFVVEVNKIGNSSWYPFVTMAPTNKKQEWVFLYVFTNKNYTEQNNNLINKKIEIITPYNI